MAYTIDEDSSDEIKEIHNRLLDDLLAGNEQSYIKNGSIETKETLLKENVLVNLKNFMRDLNVHFGFHQKDVEVVFNYEWLKGLGLNGDMQPRSTCVYNETYFEYDIKEKKDYLFLERQINTTDIQINCYIIRKCNLGCKHKTHKFYITNAVRLLDILAFWKTKTPIKDIMEMFLSEIYAEINVLLASGSRKRGRPLRASKELVSAS